VKGNHAAHPGRRLRIPGCHDSPNLFLSAPTAPRDCQRPRTNGHCDDRPDPRTGAPSPHSCPALLPRSHLGIAASRTEVALSPSTSRRPASARSQASSASLPRSFACPALNGATFGVDLAGRGTTKHRTTASTSARFFRFPSPSPIRAPARRFSISGYRALSASHERPRIGREIRAHPDLHAASRRRFRAVPGNGLWRSRKHER